MGVLLLLCAGALLVFGRPSSTPPLDERTHAIAAQLRCPVCQGESVADASTDVARDIRAVIRRRLAAGQSGSQIDSYLEARYPNISLAPSTTGVGRVAWLAPPLLLLGGVMLLLTLLADWRGRGKITPTAAQAAYLERVRAELASSRTGED